MKKHMPQHPQASCAERPAGIGYAPPLAQIVEIAVEAGFGNSVEPDIDPWEQENW